MTVIPFDDRDGFIWFDGKLVPWRDAKTHVLTHGLHYASSVFEGERIYSGRIYKHAEHTRAAVRIGAHPRHGNPVHGSSRSSTRVTKRRAPKASRTAMCGPWCSAAAR